MGQDEFIRTDKYIIDKDLKHLFYNIRNKFDELSSCYTELKEYFKRKIKEYE